MQWLDHCYHLRVIKNVSQLMIKSNLFCSAGIGRTGTVVVVDMLINQLRLKCKYKFLIVLVS